MLSEKIEVVTAIAFFIALILWVFTSWGWPAKLFMVVVLVTLSFITIRGYSELRRLRKQGLYPAPGKGTDQDVSSLAKAGYRIPAIRLYREIHAVSLLEAKTAVKKLSC